MVSTTDTIGAPDSRLRAIAVLLSGALTFGLSGLPAQIGRTIGPVVDVLAAVRAFPTLATSQELTHLSRDAQGNWWTLTSNNLVRLDPLLNVSGIIPGVTGMLDYEPTSNSFYIARSAMIPISPQPNWLCTYYPNCQLPACCYTTFAIDKVDLGTGIPTNVLAAYPTNQSLTLLGIASDGTGGVFINTDSGLYRHDALTNSTSRYSGPLPAGPFMIVPNSAIAWVAAPAPCIGNGTAFCMREYQMGSGQWSFTGACALPEVSILGPTPTQRGGICMSLEPIWDFTASQWRALVLAHGTSTFAYIMDLDSMSGSGCAGHYTFGPVTSQGLLRADIQAPGSLAWLLVSLAPSQVSVPQMPPGCVFHIDPASHVVLGPVALDQSGSGSTVRSLPSDPRLHGMTLYTQWAWASVITLGTTDSRVTTYSAF